MNNAIVESMGSLKRRIKEAKTTSKYNTTVQIDIETLEHLISLIESKPSTIPAGYTLSPIQMPDRY
jgi:nicotinate-nucleotide pyrophosphorylase